MNKIKDLTDEINLTNNENYNFSHYEKEYFDLISSLADTFIKKNRDYGSAVKNIYDKFENFGHNEGLKYIIGRISEKYERLLNLTFNNNTPNVNDESIKDTLLDLANYAILASISFDEHNHSNKIVDDDNNPYQSFTL